MARFYGSLNNGRHNPRTITGSENYPVSGHVRGWESGIEVRGRTEGEKDVFDVFKTSGSNGRTCAVLLGTLAGGVWSPNLDAKGEV